MASEPECAPVVAEPSSRLAAPRDGSASPPEPAPLQRAADFDRVLARGRRRRVGGITVVTAPGEPGQARVGLIAGRKVGNAVMRNRAKRRLRHAVRCIALPAGLDHVVIASPQVVEAPFDEICRWLEEGTRP